MYLFLKFFKIEENLKKNTSTSGCIEKYISLVTMYKKIRNRKIELKKDNSKCQRCLSVIGPELQCLST